MKIHKSITLEKVIDATKKTEYLGYCISCGHEAQGVESDAQNYECEDCGALQVFGAEELLTMLV